MFPETTLPDAAFATATTHRRQPFLSGKGLRERGLDEPQPQGKIRIAIGHSDRTMQVVRQGHPTMNFERMDALDSPYRSAQPVDTASQQIVVVTLEQVDREEVGATGMPGASIIGYG